MHVVSRRHRVGLRQWIPRAVVWAAVVVTPMPARGEPSASAEAAELYAKGRDAYAAKDREAALGFFQRAWALSRTPDIAANLALIELKLGHYRDAAEHFQFARVNMPPSATDKQEQAIVNGLSEAKLRISTLVFSVTPEAAQVLVDGVSLGQAPLFGEIYVEPGDHVIRVQAAGYGAKQWHIKTDPGSSHTLPVSLERREPLRDTSRQAPALHVTMTSPAAEGEHRSVIPIAIGSGLTIAASAAGVFFVVRANSEKENWNAARAGLPPGNSVCGSGTPYIDQCRRLRDAVDANRWNTTAATVSFIVGGVSLAATATYWLWPRHRGPRAAAVLAPGLKYVSLESDW
jgi:hypothetical protein